MKYRSLKDWDDIENSYGLVLFAQHVDELLFEFSLDTYKPSAMNTSLLIREAIETIHAIERGSIQKPNLKHIVDELCDNILRDDVAKSLLSVELSSINSVLKDPKSSDSSISTTVNLLLNQIPLAAYKKRNEELLASEIVSDQNPSKIRSLARSYITTLINYGYSDKFLKETSQKFFFYSNDRIGGNSAINDYLDLFRGEPENYVVIYRCPEYIGQFVSSGKRLGITVSNYLPDHKKIIKEANFRLRNKETYLVVSHNKGKDPYFAKSRADEAVEQFQTLIGLYHHKESPKPIVDSLVVLPDGEKYIKTTKSINPMHKCFDSKPGVASRKLSDFMDGFSMQKESFRKFNRSAELHALALSSESRENQMINLWIALESLIPNKDPDDKMSQIEHIEGSILPFLGLGYLNKILTRFSKDVFHWDSKESKKAIKNIEGNGILEKFSKLLVIEEYAEQRNRLEDRLVKFPLLAERAKYISYLLSKPKNIATALDAHSKRVGWQIRRIYRARNMIVHDGITPSYVDILIENTHDYLDTILSGLMVLASRENTLNTIDQGFKMVEMNYRSYYKSLNKKDLIFNLDNIDDLLFKHPI